VASFLLPRPARRAILHFYAFARHADDIADSPTLPPSEKARRLGLLKDCVKTQDSQSAPAWAQAYIADLQQHKSSPEHGENLLRAFLQDVWQNRYENWEDLLDYCRYSAAPVGRVVLESCGERHADTNAADALCMVLQLINHLQDCRRDYQEIDRIYLPQAWMREYGISEEALDANAASDGLNQLFGRYLDGCRVLLAQAASLPQSVSGWRLRLELALILQLAHQLVERLSREDPLQKPVKLPHWQWPVFFFRSLHRL